MAQAMDDYILKKQTNAILDLVGRAQELLLICITIIDTIIHNNTPYTH
jgi:hypothetical protein